MIDEHHAGRNLLGHFCPVLDVRGKDRAAQAEGRIIGDAHGITLVLGAEQHRDRSEEFPVAGGIVLGDVSQDRWLYESSSVRNLGANLGRLGALGDCSPNFVLELIGRTLGG
jgi:hypothetical protein